MASVYDSEDVATLWGRIVAYLLEQGGFHVSKERPSKCSVKIERRACSQRSGFLVKARVYVVDADRACWQSNCKGAAGARSPATRRGANSCPGLCSPWAGSSARRGFCSDCPPRVR